MYRSFLIILLIYIYCNICAYSKSHSLKSNVCLSFYNLYSLYVDQYFVRIIPCIQSFVKRPQTSPWLCNWTDWEVKTNKVPQKDSYEVIEERQNVVFIEWYQLCTTMSENIQNDQVSIFFFLAASFINSEVLRTSWNSVP